MKNFTLLALLLLFALGAKANPDTPPRADRETAFEVFADYYPEAGYEHSPYVKVCWGMSLYDFESGSLSDDWMNDNTFSWVVTTPSIPGYHGNACLMSGNSGVASSTSTLQITVSFVEDGSVSFLGGCYGEGSGNVWDACEFSIDNEKMFRYGALQTWETYSFDVTAGTHTFKWSYTKDDTTNPTGDAFFVDDVIFTGTTSMGAAGAGYDVYRQSYNDKTGTFGTALKIASNVTEKQYIDEEWETLDPGQYRFGALDPNVAGADIVWSDLLVKSTVDYFEITVDVNDSNLGTVSGGGTFTYGETCTLVATPNLGSAFIVWYDGDGNSIYENTYTFTVKEDATYTAQFDLIVLYPWFISQPEDGGTAEYADGDGDGVVYYGESMTLTATPNQGYAFMEWGIPVGDSYEVLSTEPEYAMAFDSVFITTYSDPVYGFDPETGFLAVFVQADGDCIQPQNFAADEVGPTSATLSWKEIGNSERWRIYYRPTQTPTSMPYDTIGVFQNPFTLTNLQPNTTYEAFVVPSCGIDEYGEANDWVSSNTIEFTTLDACPVPQNVTVDDITATTATVTWKDYSDSYRVSIGAGMVLVNETFENGIPDGWGCDTTDYAWTLVDGHLQSSNAGVSYAYSTIEYTANYLGDGIVAFDALCLGESEGESVFDACVFFIDGQSVFFKGNTGTGWHHYSFDVSSGTHTFLWQYVKDSDYNNPDGDYFAIDNVLMVSTSPSNETPIAVEDAEYTFTGLTPNTVYFVQVQGVCEQSTPWSDPVFFTTLEGQQYTITATANPTDGGNIEGAGTYVEDDDCTLTAIALEGYTFTNWTEDGAVVDTNAVFTFTVDGDRILVANFTLNSYLINVLADPTVGGTVEGADTYDHGDICTITATPNPGYQFVGWFYNNDIVSDDASYSFEVVEAITYTAVFQLIQYYPQLSSQPEAYGYAWVDSDNAQIIQYGEEVTLKARPEYGYHLDKWVTLDENGNPTIELSTDTVFTFTMDANNILTSLYPDGGTIEFIAFFELNTYEIAASANPTLGGTVSGEGLVDGVGTFTHGSECTLKATPATGYHFVGWTLNGDAVSSLAEYTFVVDGPADYVAVFAVNSYALTINYQYADETQAAPSHDEKVDYNVGYSVTSPTITGYTPDVAVVEGTMGAGAVTVTVTYTVNSYALTINYQYSDETQAAPSHNENVNYNVGYSVTSPTITGYTPDVEVVEGTMGTSDVTVTVTYTINSYALTVNYQYADETPAAPSHNENVNYNVGYSVTSPTITGYTPDVEVVEGTMGAGAVTVTVTYTVNSYALTINYQYSDETQAAPSHNENVNYNVGYSVTSPTITGYTPDVAVVEGTMGTSDVTVTVTYTINSYALTVNYQYADETPAAPSHNENVNYNVGYSVTSPTITGYTPDVAVVQGTMGAGAVTVTVTYTVNSYALTVNYQYSDETPAAPSHNETVDYNDNYSVTSPTITGYTPDVEVVEGTMGTSDVTVTVTYTINSYALTVNYQYADETPAAPSHNETVDYNDNYSVTSPTITGYTPDVAVVEGTMGTADVTVTVTYTVNSYALTVNYQYADETPAAPSHNENVDYNDNYSVTSPDITGYTPDVEVVEGTMGTSDVTVTVTYTINSYALTVNYQYADETPAAPSHNENVDYNDNYSVTSPTITGYTPDVEVVEGTMGTADVTVTVTYTVNSYALTVNYQYADGTPAATTHTENVDYNDSYSVTSPDITGYTPDVEVVEGTMGTADVTVTVTYTINSYALTVNYQYADGTPAATTHTENVDYNDSYSVASPDITGYTPDMAVVEGTMGTADVTVTVTYTVNSYALTVNYQYADGTPAAPSHSENVDYNDSYSVASPDITGYTPDMAVVEGTMGTADVTVTVTYTINSYEISATANPTDGGTINGAHTYNHFETCTLEAIPATGYHFVNWTLNGNVVSTNATYEFEVSGPAAYVANFELNSYEITVTANPSNGGSVSGADTYNHFETCTLVAIPANGYHFVNWTLNGNEVSTNATYEFVVSGPGAYVANFELNSYEITATADPTEGGTINGAGTHYHYFNCALEAIANSGYSFVNWTRNGEVVSTNAIYRFVVTESADLVAHFQRDEYEITASAEPTVGGTITGCGTFHYGELCTLEVILNHDYKFINWTLNGDVVSTERVFTFEVTGTGHYIAHLQSTVDVAEQSDITVSLFPNPVSDRLNIEVSEPVNMVEIYTINGALVSKQQGGLNKMVIDVADFAVGTYVIRLTTDNKVEIRKFVKK